MQVVEGYNGVFKNIEDAIEYVKKNNHICEVSVYDVSDVKTRRKAKVLKEYIKEYNKLKPLSEQIICTNPYEWRGINGCLGVVVCSIIFEKFSSKGLPFVVFSTWDGSVIDVLK